jgi:predicted lysophospholipase L1 biosynthesis ABC-type transport system permease subunit
MRIKSSLFAIGMMVGLFFLPDISVACPKCFGASAQQVLNAYYVSIAFMALIPVGIIGGVLTWIHRQSRRHLYSQK